MIPENKEILISVKGLSKIYRIWNSPSSRLKAPLLKKFGRFIPKLFLPKSIKIGSDVNAENRYYTDFEALNDVSFDVLKGQAVGIVGRNGSGKSTLLQLICGTLTPTTGSVEIKGRIAALLELGSGFNPEFTGVENIYLNGAVLGLSKKQMDDRFEGILNFAGIGPFIHQPIKTYSSGMAVRLAFAVQVSVDPDILIVDEALAVGDEAFQQKCFRRIQELQKNGTTILFVSHDSGSVISLCDHAVMLRNGKVFIAGTPKSVVTTYQKSLANDTESDDILLSDFNRIEAPARKATGIEVDQKDQSIEMVEKTAGSTVSDDSYFDPSLLSDTLVEYSNNGAQIENATIINGDAEIVNVLRHGSTYKLSFDTFFSEDEVGVNIGCKVKTLKGIELCGTNTGLISKRDEEVEKDKHYTTSFQFTCHLLPGTYSINVGVSCLKDGEDRFMTRIVDVLLFRVSSDPNLNNQGFVSLFDSVETLEKQTY